MNPSSDWLLKKPGGPGLLTLKASWKKYFADEDGRINAAPPQHAASVASARHASRRCRLKNRYKMKSPGVILIAVAMPVRTPLPRRTRNKSYKTTAASTRFT